MTADAGVRDAARARIRGLFDDPAARSGFVASVIGKEVDLVQATEERRRDVVVILLADVGRTYVAQPELYRVTQEDGTERAFQNE